MDLSNFSVVKMDMAVQEMNKIKLVSLTEE